MSEITVLRCMKRRRENPTVCLIFNIITITSKNDENSFFFFKPIVEEKKF